MQISKLTNAVVFTVATLAAGYTMAESVNDHRSDSVPARPNHKTAVHQETRDQGTMCDEGKMASCCEKMHKKMCDEMMEEGGSSMPCHDSISGHEAS